ncbi:CusA/CzcA family heavy metal efflux RND transporter [Pseudoalteromonas haloplanktis]|uniref:CusA/CzcA family heavy metal efflux RND transporter n=1 Tax=Pseudoalteromonas haloplanktis TaxID=228 RepID=A0ABU1BBN6_PSEHA|nr:CusA/CzcA family heavy metal efflux RND transporter [Pseudoalteromonas haloplanktis]MDQ9091667.1 CusA/CzcA family heavy metal efflux RND transporter [Pseudoalteromonas haloplanktis]
MFNTIVNAAIRNRLLVFLALCIVVAMSAVVIPKLNLDAFPDVTNVQVAINTEAPGLAAVEVEQLITYPIEAVMYALPDVDQVRSISKTGLSGVTVVFKEGVDIYFARQLVFERLQAAKELIPEGIGLPEMGPNTSGLGQVYQYLLAASPESGLDSMALRSLNDWIVKLLILPVDGVTEVLSFGGDVRQYQVNLNPNKLIAYQLDQQQVVSALEENNTNVGGWYMNRGQEQLVIRGTGWFNAGKQGLQEIAQTPLKTINGTVVTIADVAEVSLGSEIRQGAATMSTKDAQGNITSLGEVVTGVVLKRIGANTKQTIDGITSRIELINQALPDGVTFEPLYDQADLITKAVDTVVDALLLAFVFIVVVLALFLMNLRATLLVLLSIPISIGLALCVMAWFGLSANLMSLGGIAVAIGMLVDGSVVMVENIFRHLTQPTTKSLNSIQRINSAAQEVARPVFFAALIILVVFMPLFSFEGVEAKLFQPMAISIMLAIIAAVIVALVIVPALAVYLFANGVTLRRSVVLEPLDKAYKLCLGWAMNARKTVIAVAGALVVIAGVLLPQLGTEFVPELEEGTINLRVTLAPSASLDTALAVAPKLEAILLEFPEVEYALSRVGRPEVGGDPEPVNNIEIYLGLKPVSEWQSADNRAQLQVLMEKKLEQFPGLLFNFSQPIATRVDELLSGVKAQLAIKLFGADLDVLVSKGQAIEQAVKGVAGAKDVAMEQIAGEAQLVITPNRLALSRYGLSVGDLMTIVQHGIGGVAAGQIINANERYDIYVRIGAEFRNSPEAIADLRLSSPTGALVRVADVATVNIESGPPQVRRDDVQRRVVIQANVQGRDMGSVVADIRTAISEQVDLPPGYGISIGGQFENQQRAQQRLSIVVPISLALIALLLYFAFGSVGQALLILVNVPLAVIGGVVALYVSGQYLSVPSSVGFITLFGVAVLNGVVMVESINNRVKSGDSLDTAAFNGALSRLRPVLMTALTSALGLIPMLISTGIGAEIQKPLATVIVGGLFTATFLTLFVLPVLYTKFSQQFYRKNNISK